MGFQCVPHYRTLWVYLYEAKLLKNKITEPRNFCEVPLVEGRGHFAGWPHGDSPQIFSCFFEPDISTGKQISELRNTTLTHSHESSQCLPLIIGGHSQLPYTITNAPNAEMMKNRLSGTKLPDFRCHPIIWHVHEDMHDSTILFLGENDICDGYCPNQILTKIIQITDHPQTLDKKVIVTLTELTKYVSGN